MNDSVRILLVEDDVRLSALIREYLSPHGFDVRIEHRGDRACERILKENPDLVVLDLMLPGKDGLSVCQEIRAEYQKPILILTAREDDMDQVAGLEIGADDYVKKPVVPRVLLARIRALLRRTGGEKASSQSNGNDRIVFGSLDIRKTSRTVILDGNIVDLTTSEFDLLCFLASHAGVVVDRNSLYYRLKGIDYDGLDRSADLAVSRLRKKLGDDPKSPRRIKTVWGQGYLFVKETW